MDGMMDAMTYLPWCDQGTYMVASGDIYPLDVSLKGKWEGERAQGMSSGVD